MSDPKYCYICSAGRSGSTFFDLLLGGHSQLASLGEFSFLGKAIALDQTCGCGEPIRACSSWARVFERIGTEKGIDLLKTPYALRQWDTRAVRLIDKTQQTRAYLLASGARGKWMEWRAESPARKRMMPLPPSLRRGVDNSFYLYDAIREAWGKQVIVDSSKNIFKALSLYERDPAHVRLVLLTRDGRGVFHSRLTSGLSRDASIGAWLRYYDLAERLIPRNVASEHWRQVRYEELAADPQRSLAGMCEFLHIPYEPRMTDLSAGVRHVVNGNRKATLSRGEGIRLDERWRTALSSDDLGWFASRAGAVNERLGYEPVGVASP
jgi:hypothetical protein